jgi:hypothetical protein
LALLIRIIHGRRLLVNMKRRKGGLSVLVEDLAEEVATQYMTTALWHPFPQEFFHIFLVVIDVSLLSSLQFSLARLTNASSIKSYYQQVDD